MAATPARRRPRPGQPRPVAGATRSKRAGAEQLSDPLAQIGATGSTTAGDEAGPRRASAVATAAAPPVSHGADRAGRVDRVDGAGPVQRGAALVGALSLLVAAYAWLTPLTVPANRGLPFGCGAPFRPNDVGLAGQVCGVGLDERRSVAVAALAVALLGILVAVLLQVAGSGAVARSVTRLGLGLLVGIPLAAAAAVVLLAPLQVRSADGATVVSCGRAVAPTVDPFAAGLCADVPGERRGAGLALAGAAVLLGVGGPLAASARRGPA